MLGEFISWLTDTAPFIPRSECGTGWSPDLIFLHTMSDLAIACSYVVIPVQIWVYRHRRNKQHLDVPRSFTWFAILFSAFIMFCGLTHFFSQLMFTYPMYRLAGAVLGLTALASVATVCAMPVVFRAWLGFPSHREMLEKNSQLRLEIGARIAAEEELQVRNHLVSAQLAEARSIRVAIESLPTSKVVEMFEAMIHRLEEHHEQLTTGTEETDDSGDSEDFHDPGTTEESADERSSRRGE